MWPSLRNHDEEEDDDEDDEEDCDGGDDCDEEEAYHEDDEDDEDDEDADKDDDHRWHFAMTSQRHANRTSFCGRDPPSVPSAPTLCRGDETPRRIRHIETDGFRSPRASFWSWYVMVVAVHRWVLHS